MVYLCLITDTLQIKMLSLSKDVSIALFSLLDELSLVSLMQVCRSLRELEETLLLLKLGERKLLKGLTTKESYLRYRRGGYPHVVGVGAESCLISTPHNGEVTKLLLAYNLLGPIWHNEYVYLTVHGECWVVLKKRSWLIASQCSDFEIVRKKHTILVLAQCSSNVIVYDAKQGRVTKRRENNRQRADNSTGYITTCSQCKIPCRGHFILAGELIDTNVVSCEVDGYCTVYVKASRI